MNILKLRVFREVVESEGVTAAARRLLVSQPVVTGHIKALERELGASLLQRAGRRMVPTEAGWALYNYTLATLDATQRLTDEITALSLAQRGQLHLGTTGAGEHSLPRFALSFLQEHPDVDISLRTGVHSDVQNWTLSGRVDFAFVSRVDLDPHLLFEPLDTEVLVLVTAPSHPWADRGAVDTSQLDGGSFLSAPIGTARRLVEDRWFAERKLARRVRAAFDHTEPMKVALLAGLGAALLFRSTIRGDLESGKLVEVPLTGDAFPSMERGFVRRKGMLTPLQRAFIRYCERAKAPSSRSG